jgi:hypothetical protein
MCLQRSFADTGVPEEVCLVVILAVVFNEETRFAVLQDRNIKRAPSAAIRIDPVFGLVGNAAFIQDVCDSSDTAVPSSRRQRDGLAVLIYSSECCDLSSGSSFISSEKYRTGILSCVCSVDLCLHAA